MDFTTLSVAELVLLRTDIEAEIAARAGEPMLLVSDGERVLPTPSTGWLFGTEYANNHGPTILWCATEEQARARLQRLSDREKRAVVGNAVDMTSPGCHTSEAWIAPVKKAAE